jgi:hypothetical protein
MNQSKQTVLDRDVWYKRAWNSFSNSFKGSENTNNVSRGLSVLLATFMFILLVASAEYKVFEALWISTNKDFFLTASALLTTGVSAVFAEILHGNPAATKDQKWWMSTLFIVNLVVGAILGLAAYLNAGQSSINFLGYSVNFGGLINVSYGLIVLMTASEILIYRHYFNEDIQRKYAARKAKIFATQQEAQLETEESVAQLQADAERQARRILVLADAKKTVRDRLTEDYGGKVPDYVLQQAMNEIDSLNKHQNNNFNNGNQQHNSNNQQNNNHRPPQSQNQTRPERPQQKQENNDRGQQQVGNLANRQEKKSVFEQPQVRKFPSENLQQEEKIDENPPSDLPPLN